MNRLRSVLASRWLGTTLLTLTTAAALAQTTQTLEFTAGQSNLTGNGPEVSDQVITFQTNRDNPSGNAFVTQTPVTTATFSLSSQVYSNAAGGAGVMFGGQSSTAGASNNTLPASYELFRLMNGLSGSANGNYTSSPNVVTGTGIDIGVNRSVELFTDVQYTDPDNVANRPAYATLTVTFNRAVTNPVLHLTGLGASGANGASTELELLSTGVTLSKLSGNNILAVSSTSITNSGTTFTSTTATGTSTSGAASGSVRVTGTVSSLQFRLYLNKKSGQINGNGGYSYGDGWLFGISFANPNPLPVQLVSFGARAADQAVVLDWATASELHNDHFEVERSLDGSTFTAIGQRAGRGSTATSTRYAYTDQGVGAWARGPVYYRLRQVDWDGSSSYSPVRAVRFGPVAGPPALRLYPNPAPATETTLDLTTLPDGDYQVQVLEATGRAVRQLTATGGQTPGLPLAALPAGVYVVQVRGQGLSLYQRLVRQ